MLCTKLAISLISGSYSLTFPASTGALLCILLIVLNAVVFTALFLNTAGLAATALRRGAEKRAAAVGSAARSVREMADIVFASDLG